MFLKDPKDSGALFLLPFFHPLLLGSYWLLLKGLEWTRLCFSTCLTSWDCTHIRRAHLLFSFYCDFVLLVPIPPSRRRGFQFQAEELDNFLDLVESFSPFLRRTGKLLPTFIWRTIAGRRKRLSLCVVSSRRYLVGLVPPVTPTAPPLRPHQGQAN